MPQKTIGRVDDLKFSYRRAAAFIKYSSSLLFLINFQSGPNGLFVEGSVCFAIRNGTRARVIMTMFRVEKRFFVFHTHRDSLREPRARDRIETNEFTSFL